MVRWEQCAVEGGRGTFPPLAREGIKIEMSKSRVLVTWIAVWFVLYAAMENKCAERDLRKAKDAIHYTIFHKSRKKNFNQSLQLFFFQEKT